MRSLFVIAGLALAAPAAAEAATLEAARTCYANNSQVRLVGTGFAPDSPIEFSVNGQRLERLVNSDETGRVAVVYEPPPVSRQRRFVLTATDPQETSASETVYVTPAPAVRTSSRRSDDVRTWTAVFKLTGFLRGRAYLHWINPRGRLKKTARLGRLRGPCGQLRTGERRVMPFRNPQFGNWRLQFDTRRRYSRSTERKFVIRLRVYRG